MDVARPILTLIPSPNGQAFASFGSHDRLLRVWIPEKRNKFQFKYMPHPRAVVNAVWKKPSDDLRILTSSKDSLARIWIWSKLANEFQLYLTLDAPLPHSHLSFHFFNKHAIITPPPIGVLFHPPPSNASSSSSKAVSIHVLESIKQAEPELNTLLEHLDELVFAVQSNGSICIWGISNLDRRLGETSASILKVIPNCLSHSNLDTFVHLHLIHQTHVPKKDHLFWIGYSKSSNSLTCFSVHLASLLFQSNSSLSILKKWGGHIVEGPKAFYLLDSTTLISQSGNEAVVWKFQQSNQDSMSNHQQNVFAHEKQNPVAPSYVPFQQELDAITSSTSGLAFMDKQIHSDQMSLPIPLIFSYLFSNSIQHTHSSLASSIRFSEFTSASIRMFPPISESTLMLSFMGSLTLTTYQLPDLRLHYSYTSTVPIQTACFSFYPTTYDAVLIDTQGDVSLLGLDGALLSSTSFISLFPSNSNVSCSLIVQCSLSGDTLAFRTATQVYIFAIRLFTHELYLQSILDLATSHISLASPKPGLTLLALSSEHVLDVYASTLTFSSSSSSSSNLSSMDVTWSSIFKHTFDSTIELFEWTSTFELILFVHHRVQFLGLFPSLVSLALSKTSYPFYHPMVLREWLMWNGLDQVEAILNHLYFCFKSNLLSLHTAPLIPLSSLLPTTSSSYSSSSSSSSSNHGVTDFEAFLNATEASLFNNDDQSTNFHFSMEELNSFSKEKADVLKEHWLSLSPKEPMAAELIAILELMFELKQITLDDMGQRYFAEVLFYFHLGQKHPETFPSISLDAFLFAFFSQSQSTLADFLHRSFTLTWPSAKALGIGYWLTDGSCLTTTIELIARNQWRLASNPLDCFYFYLILPGKRKLMLNLWKQAHGHPEQHVLTQFLSQEVTDKWKKTALKNAFVLLGKQRFELAACFFILAEAYSDAVTVCLKNLNDPQLAFITCRLLNVPITLIAQYFENAKLTTFTSKPHPGAVFLCDWILGKTKFCSLDLVQSPAMYQLFLAHPPPSTSKNGASLNGSLQEATPSTISETPKVECQEPRRALCKILTYYRDRQGGTFCKYLLHKFNKPKEIASLNTATVDEETKKQADQVQQVDDAFAALFGETERKVSLDEETNDHPLFIHSPFPDNMGTFLTTSDKGTQPLLTHSESDQLSNLVSQLTIWDALQSQLEVVTSEHSQDAYFKDYWSVLLHDGVDLKLASRLCEWTFSPHHGHISLPINFTVYSRAYSHVLESLQELPKVSSSISYVLSFVMNTLKSLAHSTLSYDLSLNSPFFAVLLLSFIFLLFYFQNTGNYYALATLIKHFPTFFIPPYSTQKLTEFYQELVLHLSSSSTSSSHLVLDFLTVKMVFTRLESLLIELSVDSPFLVPFFINTCLPLLQQFLRRLFHEIQVQQTHICPPSEDWLSAAQQELNSVLTYNPAWLQSLRTPSSVMSPTFSSSSFSSTSTTTTTSSPSKVSSSSPSAQLLSSTDLSSNKPSTSSSSSTAQYASIDTLFKNEYPILSMALHARGDILGVALHKHVIEFHIDLAYRAKTSGIHPHSDPPSFHGAPSTTLENLPVTSEPPPLTSTSKPTGEFNLLKKVHLPRSNSEHLNLATIVTEPGFLMERPGFPVSIASHPLLNLYAVGQFVDNKSSLSLYSYQVKEDQMPMAHYGSAKITKLLFDSSGSRLGIADGNGELGFFDIEAWRLFYTLPCHVRYTSDLIFYKHDSLIATAGSSPGHINNVALWDTLMPMNYAKVRGYNIHESGASAIACDGTYLVSGGKKGDLYVLDIRSNKPLFSIQSSHHCISALALHQHRVYSGTTDGTLRVYDISTSNLTELACYKQLHQSKKLIATSLNQMPVSTLGITQILAGDHYLLTCGADGLIKWLH